jgi:hypothetical protein
MQGYAGLQSIVLWIFTKKFAINHKLDVVFLVRLENEEII